MALEVAVMSTVEINIPNTAPPDKFQAAFETAFFCHRIHAHPAGGFKPRTYNPKDWAGAWKWVAKQGDDCKFYFSPGNIKSGCKQTRKEDMLSSEWVWADLDPRFGEDLDAERAQIDLLLEEDISVPLPTMIIDSGRGKWGLWKLSTPHAFDGPDGDATRAFEAVLRGLEQAFAPYGDKSVKNINRVARLPGTVNNKTGATASVLEFNERTYTLADFPSIVVERKVQTIGSGETIPLDIFKAALAATPYKGGPEGLDDRNEQSGWFAFMEAVHEAAGGECGGEYFEAFYDWCQADPEFDDAWTRESVQGRWNSLDSDAAGGITRGSWIKLIRSFTGNDDLASKMAGDADASDEFDPVEPESKSSKARTRAINLIRNLRTKTMANGCTEDEAKSAAEKIAKFIAKFSLTEDDLKDEPTSTTVSDGSSPEWFDITRQWDYLGQQKRFLDLNTRELWEVGAFDNYFASVRVMEKNKGTPLSKYIFQNRSLPMYKSVVYEPGNQATEVGGNFNMWLPSDIEPKEGDTSKWDAHMKYLFADPVSRAHVLNYLAWVYCNQHLKPRHWLLVHGEVQGTGKSFIAHVMTRLLGRKLPNGLYSNSRLLKGKNLDADHNGWELQTKLVVIEEVRPAFGSSNAAVKMLHDLISEPTLEVDLKGVTPFQIANYLAGILFSKDDAVAIDNTDRRYLIETVDTPQQKLAARSAKYYDALYALLEDPAAMAAIAHQFMTRDLRGYSGLGAAPMTVAKTKMAEETRDELERWFDENRTSPPLSYRLVTLDEILEHVPVNIERTTKNLRGRVTNLIREKLNAEHLDKVRLGGRNDKQPRMWRINKKTTEQTDRMEYSDKRLSRIYRFERGHMTPEEKAEKAALDARTSAQAIAEARAEFDDVDVVILVDEFADLM
jgi:hypothetical protein